PIKRLEGSRFTVLENNSRTRNPISFFTVNEVAHDVVRAPRLRPLIPTQPRLRNLTQQRVESCRCTSEKLYCMLKFKIHCFDSVMPKVHNQHLQSNSSCLSDKSDLTPKAFANPSPGLERKARQPWE